MLAQVRHLNSLAHFVKTTLISAFAVLATLSPSTISAQATDLIVYYDQSQLLRLPRPVAEVIIGNHSIADVTIQGGNLLVVTGKSFGMTNVIALDAERNIIQDQRIFVERDEKRMINVHKGTIRQSFSCTPNCSPTLTIGDDADYFQNINKQTVVKYTIAAGSATPPTGGGQ